MRRRRFRGKEGMRLLFEWDEEKAAANLRKHKVDFDDAMLVFEDDFRIEYYDAAHSDEEDRYNTIGMARNVLFVVYTERREYIRIISPEKRIVRKYGNMRRGSDTMIVRKVRIPGTPLTPEQIKRLDDLENYPIVYDEDCPEMTEEQLDQFYRVNTLPYSAERERRIG